MLIFLLVSALVLANKEEAQVTAVPSLIEKSFIFLLLLILLHQFLLFLIIFFRKRE